MSAKVTKEAVSNYFSRIGKLGAARSSARINKVRAGHASAARMLRRMADAAIKAGNTAQAADLIKRAEQQERLAKA